MNRALSSPPWLRREGRPLLRLSVKPLRFCERCNLNWEPHTCPFTRPFMLFNSAAQDSKRAYLAQVTRIPAKRCCAKPSRLQFANVTSLKCPISFCFEGIHSFIHSFNRSLLSVSVPGTVLGLGRGCDETGKVYLKPDIDPFNDSTLRNAFLMPKEVGLLLFKCLSGTFGS